MRWEGGRRSTNIEDRRGLGMGTIGGGGIGMLLIVLAVSCLTGTNPLALLQMAEQVAPQQTQEVPDRRADWRPGGRIRRGRAWRHRRDLEPRLPIDGAPIPGTGARALRGIGAVRVRRGIVGERAVLLPGGSKGVSRSVVLPRARSALRRARRLRAGLRRRARSGTSRAEPARHQSPGAGGAAGQSRAGANQLSVALELQADCFAGVWGHHASRKQLLDQGDVEEGLAAAAAIGDDRLTKGRVSPDSFTHGTSAAACAVAAPGTVVGRRQQLRHVRSDDILIQGGLKSRL